MFNTIRLVGMFMCALASLLCIWMAFEWMYAGYGLHPVISLPLAVFIYVIPWVIVIWEKQHEQV